MNKNGKTESASEKRRLFAGFDVGSSFVHLAVLDGAGQIVYSPKAIMHFANPIGAVREAWGKVQMTHASQHSSSARPISRFAHHTTGCHQ